MDEIELLRGVLSGTEKLIGGVGDDQWDQPTPCPDYDVGALVDHILGWARVFASGAEGEVFEGDPSDYSRGSDPAAEFRAVGDRMVDGWREHGLDRQVHLAGADSPGLVAFNMTVMEYLT
ncbi:MAG TPA: maleylpyruvate isomerase family mycothiol-dependent enzyme, partial [Acidimicrobiales bacterium]